jgi:hypothetical protein
MTAAYRVARAAPDGYQFVLGSTDTFAQSQTLYKAPPYNAITDFAPVALIVEQPFLLVTRNDLPASNLPEFIAYARANQSKMQFGSAGPASGSYLTYTYLNSAIGVTVWSYRAGAGRAEAFLLNPQPLPARTAYEWGVAAEVVPNGKAVARARELADLYLQAPEVTRRNTRIHFIQPLKERIVREVGYGLSLEGASSADLVKSKQSKS